MIRLQVSVTEHIAVPLRVHRGRPEEGIMLHASSCYGEKKEPRYDHLTVRWAPQSLPKLSNEHAWVQGKG